MVINGYVIEPGADLSGASFRRTDMTGADLSGANLTNVDFKETILVGANLSGANFTGELNHYGGLNVGLFNADLTNANLSNANLTLVNLNSANFTGANLTGANLTGVHTSSTIFKDADLSGITFETDIFDYAGGPDWRLSSGARVDKGVWALIDEDDRSSLLLNNNAPTFSHCFLTLDKKLFLGRIKPAPP